MPAEYTEIGNRRFKQIKCKVMPECDIQGCQREGLFDAPTTAGPWGNLCWNHVAAFTWDRSTIGYHRLIQEEGA